MKNTKLLLFAGFFSLACMFSFQTMNAQIKLGPELVYGTEIDNLGIGIQAEIPVMESLTIAPDFIYYLPKKEGGDVFKVTANWFEFNANANYYFMSTEQLSVYGQAGLNYTHVKVKVSGSDFDDLPGMDLNASSGEGKIGLNLGAGINLNIINDKMIPFLNLRYVISDYDHLVISAGLKFNL